MFLARTFAAVVLSAVFVAAPPPAAVAQMGGGMGMGSSGSAEPNPQQAYSAGVVAFQAHNYAEAIRQLRIAHRAVPNNAGLNFALGLAYLGAGQKQDAQASFAIAVRNTAPPPGAWLQLGLVSLDLGDRNNAIEQQGALQRVIANCDASCGDARRGQLQTAYDQLTRALNAPAASGP